jgi:hypothetical protein
VSRGKLFPLLSAVALAGSAFGADSADPGAPERIEVVYNEVSFLPISASASFLGGDERIIEITRAKDGLELHGVQFGETLIFVFDNALTRAYAVSVIPRPSSSAGGNIPNPQNVLERRLETLTGGWLQAGSVGLSENFAAKGVPSRYLSAYLSGTTPQISYAVSGSENQSNGRVQSIDVNGWASGSWGRASFGLGQQPTGFKPVLWGQFYRTAELLLTPGAWIIDASASAPYRFDRPTFDPAAWQGRAERRWDNGAVAAAGVLEGQSGDAQAWLPYAGGGFEGSRFGAQAFVGRVAGEAAGLGSAQGHLALGPCLIGASFSSGLRGPDAPRVRAALLPYVDPGANVFLSNGQCHAGDFVFGGGATRGGVPGPLVDTRAILGTGFVSWNTGPQASAGANVQWSLNGQDIRNFASVYAYRRWGELEFNGNATGSRPMDQWTFNENAVLRRYFGPSRSVGFSTGLSHEQGPPESAWAGLDAAIENRYLRASIGGQTSVDFLHHSPTAFRMVGQVEFRPAPAYSFRAYTNVDPRNLGQWNFNGGIVYSFGDSTPREPLLWAFRSSSIEAVAFEDLNGNGVRDPGEPGMAGVEICVDRQQCAVTKANGRWTAVGLDDGERRVIADASTLPGTLPTTDSRVSPAVGSYRTPHLVFGFRSHADLVIHPFFDRNGNGRRDPDEPDFESGSASVTGPGLQTSVLLRNARAVIFQKGNVEISVDVGSLPTGFMPEKDVFITPIQTFGRVDIDIPVRPLRSLGGKVCVDENGDGICQTTEMTVGLVRVTDGREEVVADETGNFLFNDLPPGSYHVRVREEDLPPGTRQLKDVVMEVGAGPMTVTSLVIPLKAQLLARREYLVSLPRPPAGTATDAREVGGLYLRAAALAPGGEPKKVDQKKALRRLLRAARRKPSLLLISVYCDAAAFAKDQQSAMAQAMKTGTALARWLRLDATHATVEARSPTDDEEMIAIRVYQWLP